jgi:hypothetical protein
MAASRMFSLAIPTRVSPDTGQVRFTHDLRLHVAKSRGTRVTLVVEAGGETSIIHFPRGTAIEGRDLRRRISRVVPASRTTHVVTLIVMAERTSPKDLAMVSIDSDDLSVHSSK